LRLLHAVLRRSSYLALLDEQPAARQRLIDTMCASTWMAERVAQHPLLLDDLLDTRSQGAPESVDAIDAECERALQAIDGQDPEAVLLALNELRRHAVWSAGGGAECAATGVAGACHRAATVAVCQSGDSCPAW
jgi:glutamate-ammonia-ligase adenylyltransferase